MTVAPPVAATDCGWPDAVGGHSTKVMARQQVNYEEGLGSLVRMVRNSARGRTETVFGNAVSEAAGYVRSGFSKTIVVDCLNEAAISVGLEPNAEALIDSKLANVVVPLGTNLTDTASTTESPEVDRTRLKPIRWSDLHSLPKREALIEGLLDCGTFSVMYGPSGCGKTYFALDLAAHVALGRPWRGRTVLQGAAVYVAAEGGYGILERLTAFSIMHDIDPKDVPLYVIPEPIDLCNSDGDANLLTEHLRHLPNHQPVRLLVVDTVSRALAGGNENTPDHMGALVRHCDSLRAGTGAHVTLVHHTGKDVNQGARGHSLLRAAVDTEIAVTCDENGQSGSANVTKQRNARTEGRFDFRLNEVDVELTDDDRVISSCVVVPTDGPVVTKAAKSGHLPKAARTTLQALVQALGECGVIPAPSDNIPPGVPVVSIEQLREYAYSMEISTSQEERAKQQAFQRACDRLTKIGYVGLWEGQVWLIGKP